MKDYCKQEKIELHYTSPFNLQFNGRVERFNRTLQDLIYKNKEEKLLSIRLKKAIEVYNNSFHTGIQMTPMDAFEESNCKKLKEIQIENIIKFNEKQNKKGKEDIYKIDDIVLIREEVAIKKGKEKFKKRGRIIEVYDNYS